MNNKNDLLKRLLKLYPTSVVKEFYALQGKSEDVIGEIISRNTEDSVLNFVTSNFNCTKQHVYIFKVSPRFHLNAVVGQKPFEYALTTFFSTGGSHSFYCLPEVEFRAISIPYEETIINFYQPIKVTIKRQYLIIQMTILEKDISAHLGRIRVVDVTKSLDEKALITSILGYLQNLGFTCAQCDLTKGIKHLLRDNVIDYKYAKFRKDRSTSTEAMDENYTLKNEYPDIFEDIMKRPLIKTIFKYKKDDKLLCDHFTADPTIGQLSMPTYPINLNQIENVITEVLSNN